MWAYPASLKSRATLGHFPDRSETLNMSERLRSHKPYYVLVVIISLPELNSELNLCFWQMPSKHIEEVEQEEQTNMKLAIPQMPKKILHQAIFLELPINIQLPPIRKRKKNPTTTLYSSSSCSPSPAHPIQMQPPAAPPSSHHYACRHGGHPSKPPFTDPHR